jgi:hypothetical protein
MSFNLDFGNMHAALTVSAAFVAVLIWYVR